MAWTQTDLDAIDAAIASGELVVQYQDKRVTYRSIEELRAARSMIDAELNPPTVSTHRRYLGNKMGWD